MRRLWLLALLALPLPARAQVAQPQVYTLTITAADVNYVGRVLRLQPYGDVSDLLARLQAQIDQQNAALAQKLAPPKPPAEAPKE